MFGFNRWPAKRHSTRRARKNELRVETLETRVLFAGDGLQGGAPLIDGTGIKVGVISVGIEHYAAIASASSELQKASHQMAETLYKATQASGGGEPGAPGAAGSTPPADGEVVDAEFSETK